VVLVEEFSKILENMRNHSHHNTASHPRRLETSATPL
jgi:hypothetical protein